MFGKSDRTLQFLWKFKKVKLLTLSDFDLRRLGGFIVTCEPFCSESFKFVGGIRGIFQRLQNVGTDKTAFN